MEISLDQNGSTKYYDEVLAVLSNYKKLVKNPRKKVSGLTSTAVSLISSLGVHDSLYSIIFEGYELFIIIHIVKN